MSQIPSELTSKPRWITYRTELNLDGKLDKIPVNLSGYGISYKEPSNWMNYSKVEHLQHKAFVITGDGICCLDLDGFNVEPKPAQRIFYELLRDCAIENSISGKGKHLWFNSDIKGSLISYAIGIELYVSSKFIAIGEFTQIAPLPFVDASTLLEVWKSVAPVKKPVETVVDGSNDALPSDVQALINLTISRNYGSIHKARINGNLSYDNGDWSKAAWQLCKAFAYHSNKNKSLMLSALNSCPKLLALRPNRETKHTWNGKFWIEELVNYACS